MTSSIVLFTLLLLAIVGVLLGGAIGAFAREQSVVGIVGDGLARGAVPCIVVLRIVPELVRRIGVLAVALALLGYAVLRVLDHEDDHRPTGLALSIVVIALGGHSLLDGAALSLALPSRSHVGVAELVLAAAIVGHRVAEGLVAGNALSPHVGTRRTMLAVGVLGLATAVGAYGARAASGALSGLALQAAIALGMGMLVRVVVHRPVVGQSRLASAMRIAGVAVGCCAALASGA